MSKNNENLMLPKKFTTHCWDEDWLGDVNNAIVRHSKNNNNAKSFNAMAIKLTPQIQKIMNEYKADKLCTPERYDEIRRKKQCIKKEIKKCQTEISNDSTSLQKLLSKNKLTYDEKVLETQLESSKKMIDANKQMGILPTDKESEEIQIIESALKQSQELEKKENDLNEKIKDYKQLKNIVKSRRNKIIELMNGVVNVLKTYKQKSNNKKSDRGEKIQNLIKDIEDDLKTLKKQKTKDAADDKSI